MPGSGQVQKRLTATGRLEDTALHGDILVDRRPHWLPAVSTEDP